MFKNLVIVVLLLAQTCQGMNVPVVTQPQQTQGMPAVLPSRAAIDSRFKIREFFKVLHVNNVWEHTLRDVQVLLTQDPWLLNERDASTNALAVCYVADRWIENIEQGNGGSASLLQSFFQYLLQCGQNDRAFLQVIGELRNFLTRNRQCQPLIDDFNQHFPGQALPAQQPTGSYRIFSPPHTAALAATNTLSDDQRAQLMVDIFDAVENGDFNEAKRLLAAYPWLIHAENRTGKPLIFAAADAARDRVGNSANQDANAQAIFSFLLVNGADLSKVPNYVDSFDNTRVTLPLDQYVRTKSRMMPVQNILADFRRDPAIVAGRLDRFIQQPIVATTRSKPGGAVTATSTSTRSFWKTWKPWAIGLLSLGGVGAWYYYHYKKPASGQTT